MPPLSDISYSRDETIQSIRRYYDFLITMYLDDSFVTEPPPGGWPGITVDRYRGLGKTDEVVNLLRHLPYLRHPDKTVPSAVPYGSFIDWDKKGRTIEEDGGSTARIISEDVDLNGNVDESVPSSVIGLVQGEELDFLLDTNRGIVYWTQGCPEELRDARSVDSGIDFTISQIEDDVGAFAGESWQAVAPAWSIPDFFELLKSQFRALNFLPITEHDMVDTWAEMSDESDGLVATLQDIYRQNGWPPSSEEDTIRYSKTRCLAEIRQIIASSYPDYVTWPEDDDD